MQYTNRLWLAIQQETYSCYRIFIPDHRIESIPFLLYVNQQVICIAKGEDCQRVTCLFSKCFVSPAHSQFEPLVLYNHAIFRCHSIHRLNIHSLWSAIFTVCGLWWRSPLQKVMHLFPENITWHNCLIVIYFTSELPIQISDFILCSVETSSRLIHSVNHTINFQCVADSYSHSLITNFIFLNLVFHFILPSLHPFIPLSHFICSSYYNFLSTLSLFLAFFYSVLSLLLPSPTLCIISLR